MFMSPDVSASLTLLKHTPGVCLKGAVSICRFRFAHFPGEMIPGRVSLFDGAHASRDTPKVSHSHIGHQDKISPVVSN